MRKIILAVALFANIGCSTMQPSTQALTINCDPQNLNLRVNGDKYNCPTIVDVKRNNKVVIGATKEGFEPYSKTIDYHFSGSGVMDVLGTCVWFFPVFGLFSAGAWDLDQTELNITMTTL